MSTTLIELAPNGEGHYVDIDPDAPWAGWPVPDVYNAKVGTLNIAVDDLNGKWPRLVLEDDTGLIGYPSAGGLQNISTRVGFPMPFVEKLDLEVQAAVINCRFRDAREQEFSMVREPLLRVDPDTGAKTWSERSLVTNIAPGWRGVLPHADVCQQTFNVMASVWGPQNVEIKLASKTDSHMIARFLSPMDDEVAPGGRRVGDVLRLGVEVEHQYGMELAVRLFAVRLVCLNGMTNIAYQHDWTSRQLGSASRQLDTVEVGVAEAIGAFNGLVTSARRMAEAQIEGNPERMLIERAKAMRLPPGLHGPLLAAWREEPTQSEWGLLNAFTRLATHGDVTRRVGSRIMAAAGDWAQGFDIVTARLPRPMAEAVGAHIVEESPLNA